MRNRPPKKVAAVHDIAGFGRSSLTVVLPTLSAMGHQACPAPTAVLSSITGFYSDYEMVDMTDFLARCFAHWEKENCTFDCVYTGFIGSAKGTDIAEAFIRRIRAPLTVVDPVFADDGKCYDCFDAEMAQEMQALIRLADVITPNLTEACFLTGEAYAPNLACAQRCMTRLCKKTDASILITGVPCEKTVAVLLYDREASAFWKIENPYVHKHYPGTGDLFTSVLTGALLNDQTLGDAAAKAADFVFAAMEQAEKCGVPVREGVPMELLVPRLLGEHMLPIEKIKW